MLARKLISVFRSSSSSSSSSSSASFFAPHASLLPLSSSPSSFLSSSRHSFSSQSSSTAASSAASAHASAASYNPPPAAAHGLLAVPHPFSQFRLSAAFVGRFRELRAPFGFNGLGELVYRRTYSRLKDDGKYEEWYETVERVVNGCYNMQKRWIEIHRLGWNAAKAQKSAQEMYTRIFHLKFLPPGRGLWAMGSPITEKSGLFAALNNCAFVSTEGLKENPSKPFCFLMDASMLGVGVGFDTKGAGSLTVKGFNAARSPEPVTVPDSREGWVDSTRALLDSYFHGLAAPQFDYSAIRPAGQPIRQFGGLSSGPGPLKALHESLRKVLDGQVGRPLSVTAIVDIMNLIGRCVVSGNVRQTAEIAFGDPASTEYIDLKNYEVNPHRAEYGWTSNNSVFAKVGMDYTDVCERVARNGEPGFAWLENMQAYSRMNGTPDHVDRRARGGNPCLEQTLESYELCCLVETFPANHDSLEDFKRTLKFAYLYAKTVTLGQTHWPETNRVLLRNRRIGCSMSGVAQFIARRGIEELRVWCEEGYRCIANYDVGYSEWLAIPRSIKTTSVKPSGTVSLLAGATPGLHYPESRFYIRRMRLSAASELVAPLRAAGYPVEPAAHQPQSVVVEFPIDAGDKVRVASDLSMWEQLCLAAFMQRHWADNQVSATVTFDPVTEGPQLKHALDYFQYGLKGISFLPRLAQGAYPQMPYEAITEDEYKARLARLSPLTLPSSPGMHPVALEVPEKFCDSEKCQL